MSSFQRVVKYIGMALAILITIGIIFGVCSLIFGISHSSKRVEEETTSATSNVYEFDSFTSMQIDCGVANVEIKVGDGYQVETKDVPEETKIEVNSKGKLVVQAEDDTWFQWFDTSNWDKNSKIYITVPEGYEAEEITISGGVGDVSVYDLSTKKLTVDGGVGNVKGTNLVAGKVDVDAGVGNIDFDTVEFGDCIIDSGVGDINISGKITGDSEFNGGVGEMDLDIDGSRSDYSLSVDSGVGTVRVNGQKIEELEEHKDGTKEFIVDGGVGSITIRFTQDE